MLMVAHSFKKKKHLLLFLGGDGTRKVKCSSFFPPTSLAPQTFSMYSAPAVRSSNDCSTTFSHTKLEPFRGRFFLGRLQVIFFLKTP